MTQPGLCVDTQRHKSGASSSVPSPPPHQGREGPGRVTAECEWTAEVMAILAGARKSGFDQKVSLKA